MKTQATARLLELAADGKLEDLETKARQLEKEMDALETRMEDIEDEDEYDTTEYDKLAKELKAKGRQWTEYDRQIGVLRKAMFTNI